MTELPSRQHIRNFNADIEPRRLFRKEGLALGALFAEPTFEMAGLTHAQTPGFGNLRITPRAQVAGIGLIVDQSLEVRIRTSLQTLYSYYQWHQKLCQRVDLEAGQIPTMSYLADHIDHLKKEQRDYSTAELRERDDNDRPAHAGELTIELYKALLLEVGTLHLLLHQEGARDAVSAIRDDGFNKIRGLASGQFLHSLRQHGPLAEQELRDVQKRVDTIYEGLQKGVCAAIPDAAIAETIEHPLSSALSKSSLEEIRQLYFHMYSGRGQDFAARYLNNNSAPNPNQR